MERMTSPIRSHLSQRSTTPLPPLPLSFSPSLSTCPSSPPLPFSHPPATVPRLFPPSSLSHSLIFPPPHTLFSSLLLSSLLLSSSLPLGPSGGFDLPLLSNSLLLPPSLVFRPTLLLPFGLLTSLGRFKVLVWMESETPHVLGLDGVF